MTMSKICLHYVANGHKCKEQQASHRATYDSLPKTANILSAALFLSYQTQQYTNTHS